MSHTTRGDLGTTFIHNGDYSGDVTVTVHAEPRRVRRNGGPESDWQVQVPFESPEQGESEKLKRVDNRRTTG